MRTRVLILLLVCACATPKQQREFIATVTGTLSPQDALEESGRLAAEYRLDLADLETSIRRMAVGEKMRFVANEVDEQWIEILCQSGEYKHCFTDPMTAWEHHPIQEMATLTFRADGTCDTLAVTREQVPKPHVNKRHPGYSLQAAIHWRLTHTPQGTTQRLQAFRKKWMGRRYYRQQEAGVDVGT